MKLTTLFPALALVFIATASVVRADDDGTDTEIARVKVPEGHDDDEYNFIPVPKSSVASAVSQTQSVLPITSTVTASETNTISQTVMIPATTSVTNTVTASATSTVAVLEVTPTTVETVTSTTPVIASTEVTVSQVTTVTVSATDVATQTAVATPIDDDDDHTSGASHVKAGAAAVVAVVGGMLLA